MSKHSSSTRRMFLKCGALLAGPIAAVSLPALALTKERPEGGLQARVARLEDEAAIRRCIRRGYARSMPAAAPR